MQQKNMRATGECVYPPPPPVLHTVLPKYEKNAHPSLHDFTDNFFINSSSRFDECMYRIPLKLSDFIVSCPS